MFGIHHSRAQYWVKQVRDFIAVNDPTLIRNRNLSNPQNLVNLFETAHQCVLNCPRTLAIYSPQALPGTRVVVIAIDSKGFVNLKYLCIIDLTL